MRRSLRDLLPALVLCQLLLTEARAQTFAERIVGGFSVPTFAAHAPGDASRLFIGEIWNGNIRVLDLATRTLAPQPFLSITDLPDPLFSEQGVLGLAFDPEYATNGHFYVNYTSADGHLTVRRYRVLGDPATSNVADPNSGQVILRIPKPQWWHNGGWIDFGPNDGYLYISTGDPGGANSQDLTNSLHGKILRVDVDADDFGDDPARNYAIPPDNPFVGKEGDDEIWSHGLRNPWRASFDRQTGDLWINDVGELAREEVIFQPADSPGGENYGWPWREGTVAGPQIGPPGIQFSEPIYDYPRVADDPRMAGTVIAGGGLYRGPVAALRGHYLFNDFGSGNIWKLDPDAINPRSSVTYINDHLLPDLGGIARIAAFSEDANGNMYLMEFEGGGNGEVFRIATTARTAVWNGDDAAAGTAGDGASWSDAKNWTRDGIVDVTAAGGDEVIFAAGSSHSVINLGNDRNVAAIHFSAPFEIENHKITVQSGNVTVDAGVTAVVRSNLAAETEHHSIRKLGEGTLIVEGSAGQIAVKAGTLGGTGTVQHLTVRSGSTVAPGNAELSTGVLNVNQSLTMHDGARLVIEIAGRDNSLPQAAQFDQLLIGAAAKLDGVLEVKFLDAGDGQFNPAAGDSFSILTAIGGISGSFHSLELPTLPVSLHWEPLNTGNALHLLITPRLSGDYNSDGTVDAADYVVWRKSLGETGLRPAADGGGPNGLPDRIVDLADYEFWRANFGRTLDDALSRGIVPEPALAYNILLAICFFIAGRLGVRQRGMTTCVIANGRCFRSS